MRKTLVAAMSMALFLGAATPAFAQTPEPARASAGAAFGLAGSGLLPISPTPAVAAAQPPDSDQQILGQTFQSTIPLDLGGLAVNGTISAVAQAASEPRIQTALPGSPDGVSARGLGRTEGLSLLGDVDLLTALGLDPFGESALLTATAVEAEATATCVSGQPVFTTDSRVIGLELLDIDLGSELLDPVLRELLGLLNIEGILEIVEGETGVLPDGGVFVNALRITVLGTLQELIIGHAEAKMPADCRVPPPATLAPIGGGPGPGGGALAATGTELPFLPMGLGIVALGAILNRVVRRTARRTTV